MSKTVGEVGWKRDTKVRMDFVGPPSTLEFYVARSRATGIPWTHAVHLLALIRPP